MATATMIDTIRSSLTAMKWKVTPTKKATLDYNEMIVRIEDVDVVVDTISSYIANVYVQLEYNTMDGDKIPTQIVSLVSDLEYRITSSTTPSNKTFKFVSSQVDDLGQLYKVIILVYYREVINLV